MRNEINVSPVQESIQNVTIKYEISSYTFQVILFLQTQLICFICKYTSGESYEITKYQAIDSFVVGHLFFIYDGFRHGGGQQ